MTDFGNRINLYNRRSRTPSPKRLQDLAAEQSRLRAINVGNHLIGNLSSVATYENPMEDPDEPVLPRTSMSIVFGLILAASLAIACYLVAIVVHEYQVNAQVAKRLGGLQDTQELLLYNLTVIDDLLRQTRDNLLRIEFDVDGLQMNLTSLSQRIADLNCTGIRTFNFVITAADQFGHGGGNAWIREGIPEFITIDTVNATITINGTALQALIDTQEGQLQLLQGLLSAVQAALALVEQQALLRINEEGSLGNNIDFVGPCNASFIQGNNTVIINGCSVRDEIDRQFQVVYAQFLAALAKIASLRASIAYINTQIAYVEAIIANVTQNGLKTINGVGPGVGGAFGLVSPDAFLNVTSGPASNEIRLANQAILTMNNGLTSNPATSDFQITAGSGIGVVNDDPAGTVTINNLGVAPLCEITQTAISITGNTVTDGLSGLPLLGYQFFDANFNSAATVSVPAGCAGDTSQLFQRRGVADPFVAVVNTICKPAGRWILQFNMQGTVTTYGANTFFSLAWGLGSVGNVLSSYTLASVNLITGPGNIIPTHFTAQYTITDETPWCYNVTWITGQTTVAAATLNKWVFTRIN